MGDKFISQITEGISVQVETFYKPEHNEQIVEEHLFAYRITIENLSEFPIKLHARHWEIMDANGSHRIVDGEGVVGEQPIINPGEQFQYVSAVNLESVMGSMQGYYTMINLYNQKSFNVIIPEFTLVVPYILN